MTTPMASSLKLLSVGSSEMVDVMMYHQMICSFMFLTEVTRRRLSFELEMKELDMMHYFIGMEVWQNIFGTREV